MVDEDVLVDDPSVLLGYMRQMRKPVFHNSNVFFRDVQFAVQDYFEDVAGKTISMRDAERIAKEVSRSYEQLGVFKRVNPQGYLLNYPDLLTPKSGTIGLLDKSLPLPPMAGSQAAALKAAEALVSAAPAAKPAAKAPAAKAPAASSSATTAPAPASAKPTTAPAPSGAAPAGAKAPPPWLKK